jgi:hypothetical protein
MAQIPIRGGSETVSIHRISRVDRSQVGVDHRCLNGGVPHEPGSREAVPISLSPDLCEVPSPSDNPLF